MQIEEREVAMFVKLSRLLMDERGIRVRGKQELAVVPRREHLYEVDEMEYWKVAVAGAKEYEEHLLSLGSCFVFGAVPEVEGEFEFIDLSLHREKEEVWDNVVVLNASVYIMSNEGKTIDSIHV